MDASLFDGGASWLLGLAVFVAVVVGNAGIWMSARKAGLRGMGTFTMIRVAGLEKWKIPWYALTLGPALLLVVPFAIARRFGKGRLFGLGLLFLPFVFFPILGFGKATCSPVAVPGSARS
jgi:hypothetical protein